MIKSLFLNNFRNVENISLTNIEKINIFIGKNGSGKTNIIESIYILSNIRSFRNVKDIDLIKWGEKGYYIKTVNDNDTYEMGSFYYNGLVKKKVKISDHEIRKSSEYIGRLLTVILTPDDIQIINDSPDIRRRYFDSVLAKSDRNYYEALHEFKRVLLSRNRLLKIIKEKRISNYSEQLEVWDELFVLNAFYLINERTKFSVLLNDFFANAYNQISDIPDVPCFKYLPNIFFHSLNELKDFITFHRSNDIKAGITTFGPQKDNYVFTNNENINLLLYGSQGQKRTTVIALKIAEKNYIERIKGNNVILLIDDIFSELDNDRKENLMQCVKKDNQVFFTMVNITDDIRNRFKDAKILTVSNGNII